VVTDWNALRPLDGSREKGFEELCCQLAAGETYPADSTFVRVGAPDAGVECFWTLPAGDEHGWQAKFFTEPPTAGQWGQIDDSVKTAIDKHPRLTQYTVCLPVDRHDARVVGQKSLLDKWNQHVEKWQKLALSRSMSVAFAYWGSHELTSRLSRNEHRGRHWFWFHQEQFTLKWFRKQLDIAVQNAGERYTPSLHIDLPIARYLAALGRTPAFDAALNAIYIKIRESSRWFTVARVPPAIKDATEKAGEYLLALCGQLDSALESANGVEVLATADPINWIAIRGKAESLARHLQHASTTLWALAHQEDDQLQAKSDTTSREGKRSLDETRYHCEHFSEAISGLLDFCDGSEATLANQRALLLVGEAGQGKTHLLCDIAEKDLKEGRPRLLLHGAHFTNGEPWSQITKELGINCTTDDFLGALTAAGQAYRCRILLLIDALNEGDGRLLWEKYLAGMLGVLASHPWLGIAVTVRSAYEDLVIPTTLVPARLTRVMHRGFEEHEYEAVHRFFVHYGLQPTYPLLLPEFSNPLFLKLFCQGIKDNGWSQVPLGLRGITAILDMFLDGINAKLARPDKMDYDRSAHFVRLAVDALVGRMAASGQYWLERGDAIKLIGAIYKVDGYERSLFRNLVSEGVLAENRVRTESGVTEVVTFAYERFGDHLVAKRLIGDLVNVQDPKKAFGKRSKLSGLWKTEADAYRAAGLIEAMSIHLPEHVGMELFELAPHAAEFRVFVDAFVKSLVWRQSTAFSTCTHARIRHLSQFERYLSDLLNALLTLAPVVDHPLNANKLHSVLSRHSMPDRDAFWSIFVHREWGRGRAVNRLIDWTASDSDKSRLPDDVVLLMATALAWLFTTSNRFARDRATKALVRLTENRLDVIRELLRRFWSVDDPYVLERVLAAAYGAIMRSSHSDGLNVLAQEVFDNVFRQGRLLPQLLTREYARGIIECARHRGVLLPDKSPERRHRSTWPNIHVPHANTFKKRQEWREKMTNAECAQHAIYSSVMGTGLSDFSHYVIGGLEDWTSIRIGKEPPMTAKQQCEDFIRQLTPRSRKVLAEFQLMIDNVSFVKRMSPEERAERVGAAASDEQLDAVAAEAEQKVIQCLRNPKLLERFRTIVKPYILAPHRFRHAHEFDGELARRWMVQRVLKLGWTGNRFGDFDYTVNRWTSSYRSSQKAERIGKKYQWIAFHEMLARLSDNFYLRRERFSEDVECVEYSGLWDLSSGGRRDIDPAVVIRTTSRDDKLAGRIWWSPVSYSHWKSPASPDEWAQATGDLPDLRSMFTATSPEGIAWYVLDTFAEWAEPPKPGRNSYDLTHRSLWYFIRSYVVRRPDAAKFFRWAKRQNFMGRWMPEPTDIWRVSLGEFYWSEMYRNADGNDGPNHWTRGNFGRVPVDVVVTRADFLYESSGFDCSLDESIRIALPSEPIVEGMGLQWTGVEGRFANRKGEVAAFDPSVFDAGPGALLVRQDAFREYLDQNDLELFWTVLGEKRLTGGWERNGFGWIEISGVYRLTPAGIVGGFTTRHMTADAPRRRRPSNRKKRGTAPGT
jgi:hypothetical protein